MRGHVRSTPVGRQAGPAPRHAAPPHQQSLLAGRSSSQAPSRSEVPSCLTPRGGTRAVPPLRTTTPPASSHRTTVQIPPNPLVSEFDRGAVPPGLVTRRALRAMNLSPGHNTGPVAILRCKLCATRPDWSCRHPTRGYLLRVDLALPKRVPTLARERALDHAMAARSTCPECHRRYYFCLQAAVLQPMQHTVRTIKASWGRW
ncbi:RRQRL motif-containing zinc-binding protein [Streptomyces sp. NPDC059095]|uniref:RRQRL motif-containing zinc-binding protein n=1 Tax=Streptomyces sp. NPDC059095 TaxID=3346726 RepID=UPI0036812A2A